VYMCENNLSEELCQIHLSCQSSKNFWCTVLDTYIPKIKCG